MSVINKNKAIKYRIYPSTKQEILINKTFGCCRKVWNLMLNDKINSYNETKSFGKQTPVIYKKKFDYLKEVDSLALCNVQLNLEQAFRNCFKSKYCKFPKFKSAKHSRKSFTTNNQKGSIKILDDKHIKIPKLKIVKAKIHRKPQDNWQLKSATISKDADNKYYVSMLFEYEIDIKQVSKNTDKIIGLDYKSDGLYMSTNNKIGSKHKFYRKSQKILAKKQRKLKHKKIGSNNYIKQQIKTNKVHKHITNQRKDYLHKLSTKIANSYDIVCVEDLNMKAMSNKGFGNGKATLDNGYGMFINMLDYKLADRGKYFVKVDKWYPSSQICSQCGKKHKLELKDRIYKCECGLEIDRDLNSAINIKKEGMRLLMSA